MGLGIRNPSAWTTLILHPERAARLIEHNARDSAQPALEAVLDRTVSATVNAPQPAGLAREVKRAVDAVVVYHLMSLAASDAATQQTRSAARAQLTTLPIRLGDATALSAAIKRFLDDPAKIPLPRPLEAPPGQPI